MIDWKLGRRGQQKRHSPVLEYGALIMQDWPYRDTLTLIDDLACGDASPPRCTVVRVFRLFVALLPRLFHLLHLDFVDVLCSSPTTRLSLDRQYTYPTPNKVPYTTQALSRMYPLYRPLVRL